MPHRPHPGDDAPSPAATAEHSFGPRPPLDTDQARAAALQAGARVALLVEGWSDQAAVEALARRRGWDLTREGILVLTIGGVTHLGSFIQALGSRGPGLTLAGLCDAAELAHTLRVRSRRLRPTPALPAGRHPPGLPHAAPRPAAAG